MKKTILFLFAIILFVFSYSQGYHIKVQYRPVKNGYLYLGYYYGDKKYLQDSAALQPDGTVTFRGDKLLTGGLYILVDEQKQRFTDLLIDQEQNFQVRLDTSAFTIQSIREIKLGIYQV